MVELKGAQHLAAPRPAVARRVGAVGAGHDVLDPRGEALHQRVGQEPQHRGEHVAAVLAHHVAEEHHTDLIKKVN